jgi:DNA-binding MarR family transcriptional regulator
MRATDTVPLARLLAMGYRWMIDELHADLRARGWEGIRPAYGFVLLAVRDESLTPTALATMLDVTKQAASKLADAMVIDGLLVRTSDELDHRARRLRLTSRGVQLLAAVEEIYAELERLWADNIGEVALRQTKVRLTNALTAVNGGTLPTIRPTG